MCCAPGSPYSSPNSLLCLPASGGEVALSLSWPFNQGHVFPLPSLQQHQGFAPCTASEFREPKWPENKIVVFGPAVFWEPGCWKRQAGCGSPDVVTFGELWEEGGVLEPVWLSLSQQCHQNSAVIDGHPWFELSLPALGLCCFAVAFRASPLVACKLMSQGTPAVGTRGEGGGRKRRLLLERLWIP